MGQVQPRSVLAPATGAQIIAPRQEDLAALPALLTAAFGPGRFAKTSERVRERGAGLDLSLSRLAVDGGQPVGCCLMSHVLVGGRPALFLGPLAVHPRAQKSGLGAELVRACLHAGQEAKAGAVVLVGAPAFFAPFGFSAVPKGQILLPGPVDPVRLLWVGLHDGALEGLAGRLTGSRGASPT